MKPETMDKLSKKLRDLGCDYWRTRLGGEGVTVHNWTADENMKKS